MTDINNTTLNLYEDTGLEVELGLHSAVHAFGHILESMFACASVIFWLCAKSCIFCSQLVLQQPMHVLSY